ncbi:retrovirus-related pol polyprotein from transposon TNT 1-94 [Tanacetum coccineum]|uniref:Retrovirus-related pol polyprotein from transposon TNT 1-94 n=1 Tax=Tanacetum coccineum TaxID=301880 RepID=A0ABQ5FQY2_9ASTR
MVTTLKSSDFTSGLNNQSLLVQNPLFLHPYDGHGTLVVQEKLIGAQNYRSWKRFVEIALFTKRKLCFIRGTMPRSLDDPSLQEQWDTLLRLLVPCFNKKNLKGEILDQDSYGLNKLLYIAKNQKAKGGMKSSNAPVKRTTTLVKNGGHVVFTSKQFEQLLKSIPHFNQNDEANLEMRSDHMSPESNDLDDIHSSSSLFTTFNLNERDIKVVRSDNAIDFLKGSLGPLMDSLGIEHQTSCADRPQHNGRVEIRHINISEIARALRLHAHLPIHYWGDCVLIATYLINRFPTVVLKFKTPYEFLLSNKPVYEHLRVFELRVETSRAEPEPAKARARARLVSSLKS